jgi:hypothetical protein
MKKGLAMLVAAMVTTGLICAIGSAAAMDAVDTANIDWESYFDTPNFNGDAFVNKTVETDVPEEQELKKDWEIKDGRIFKPDWSKETSHTTKPDGWFAVSWITPGISG